MPVDVRFTSDPEEALRRTRSRLHGDPVRHNVVCTLLTQRREAGERIRYWWAEQDGHVAGTVFQSPSVAPAALGTLADGAVEPLARAIAEATPRIDAINGFASDVARFSGAFATVTRRPGRPVLAQRLYEIRDVTPPAPVAGGRRPSTPGDLALVTRWVAGFEADTGGSVTGEDPADRARTIIGSGRLNLWEEGGAPRASAFVSTVEAGVARVGFVYTPPGERGRGYASALVAALSADVLDAGHRCILYTQLINPVSNAIYQRLGYRPVDEQLGYRFDDPVP